MEDDSPRISWLSPIAVGAALSVLASLVAGFLSLFSSDSIQEPEPSQPPVSGFVRTADFERELAALRDELAEVERSLQESERPLPRALVTTRLRNAEAAVASVDQRLDDLERALTETPADALRLPLLQTRLEATERRTAAEIRAVGNSADRQYDLMKWVVGTLAVGLIAIGASVVVAVVKQ